MTPLAFFSVTLVRFPGVSYPESTSFPSGSTTEVTSFLLLYVHVQTWLKGSVLVSTFPAESNV
jgi:hypothetical protein